jgi:PAS domain S-box-containing protein
MEKAKILIAEDETIVAMDIKRRLISLGHEVIAIVATAEACIRIASEEKPDLVLMDIILKGKSDGISAAEEIKANLNIPIVFLTAHSDDQTIQRAKLTEPYGYIIKPFEIKDLQSTIEIALYKARMEARLAESELKYRTLVLTATDAVLTLDEDGSITSCNNKVLQMFDYEESELWGESIKKILPDVFVNHLVEGVKRFMEAGKPVSSDTLELTAKKKNGVSFPVEFSFSQWKTNDKIHFTLIIRDITKRKSDEKALLKAHLELEMRVAERTAELRSLIDQSPIAITNYNMHGEAIYVNKAWESIWKLKLRDLNKLGYNLFADEVLERYGYLSKIKEFLGSGGSIKTKPLYFDPMEYLNIRNNDGLLLVFHFYGVVNDKGKVFRIIGMTEDITDKMKTEEANLELKESKLRAALIIESLEEERSRISRELHDGIGQIISAAKLNIEAFEKTSPPDFLPLLKSKQLLSQAGAELKNIIYALHPTFLDNYGLPVAIKVLCDEINNSTGIKTELQISELNERIDPKIELYSFRIVQEALNNIMKHSQAATAKVDVYALHNHLYICIKDDGKGFNINAVLDEKDKREFGLINIKERVKMLDGNAQIDSREGWGTEISIEIPLKEGV